MDITRKITALIFALLAIWMGLLVSSGTVGMFISWLAYLVGCASMFILGAGLMVWHIDIRLKQAGYTEVQSKRMLLEKKS